MKITFIISVTCFFVIRTSPAQLSVAEFSHPKVDEKPPSSMTNGSLGRIEGVSTKVFRLQEGFLTANASTNPVLGRTNLAPVPIAATNLFHSMQTSVQTQAATNITAKALFSRIPADVENRAVRGKPAEVSPEALPKFRNE